MRQFTILVMAFGLWAGVSQSAWSDYSAHRAHHYNAAMQSGAEPAGALDTIFGERIEPDMKEVEKHPLGAAGNPVRCDMPGGERAYLNRLRCENNRAPKYRREGSDGLSPWGTIMDIYNVQCSRNNEAPKAFTIFMDMYHPDYQEKRAVEGFAIVPPRKLRLGSLSVRPSDPKERSTHATATVHME